jgi:hypothetical protein
MLHREHASNDILAARGLLREADDRADAVLSHSPFSPARLKLSIAAIDARLALLDGDWQRALNCTADLETLCTPRARALTALFRADAFFELGLCETNAPLTFEPGHFIQDVHSGSRSPELAQTLRAITACESDAEERVLRALDCVEAAARRAPLEADYAFARLARAAVKCGAKAVATRAELRSRDYAQVRALAISRVVNAEPAELNNA